MYCIQCSSESCIIGFRPDRILVKNIDTETSYYHESGLRTTSENNYVAFGSAEKQIEMTPGVSHVNFYSTLNTCMPLLLFHSATLSSYSTFVYSALPSSRQLATGIFW